MLRSLLPTIRRSRSFQACFTTSDGPFSSKMIHLEETDLNSCNTEHNSHSSNFYTKLSNTIKQWRKDEQIKAAWIHLHGPKETILISDAFKAGFIYHHGLNDTLVMCQWLDEKVPNKIPPYATHQVGCAGVVTIWYRNDDNGDNDDSSKTNKHLQVLLIREPSSYEKWKIPGGLANKGEDFGDAATREVFEETGIMATFNNVMVMRNQHNLSFGKSDLYVVSHLTALDGHSTINIDTDEIDEAKWFNIHDWKSMTNHPINLEVIEQLESMVMIHDNGSTHDDDAVTNGNERRKIGNDCRLEETKTKLDENKPTFCMYVPRSRSRAVKL
jgi:ADP-ribose pyrophosphatase YjhB (NUDIX family)